MNEDEKRIEALGEMLWYCILGDFASEQFHGDEIFEIFPEYELYIIETYQKFGENYLPVAMGGKFEIAGS